MSNYYEIQYRSKEDPEAWFPTTSLTENRFLSYVEACDSARQLVYEERAKARKDRHRYVVEYRVVEQIQSYIEEPLKVFPIQESIFV